MLEVSIAPDANADQTGLREVPVFIMIELRVVLKMVSPLEGKMMAFCWVVVIRGNKKPLLVLLTSSIALVSGKLPSALMETFCANRFGEITKDRNTSSVIARFFIYTILYWINFWGLKVIVAECYFIF